MSDYLERNGAEWRTNGPKVEPAHEAVMRWQTPGDGGKSWWNGWLQHFTLHHPRDKDPEVRVWLDEAAELVYTQRQWTSEQLRFLTPPNVRWFRLGPSPPVALELPLERGPLGWFPGAVPYNVKRHPVRLNRIAGAILAEWPPHPHSKPSSCASWRKPA